MKRGLSGQSVIPESTGEYSLDFSLLGIKCKTATVNVIEPCSVIASGKAIGIKVYMDGALIVGMSEIPFTHISPGKTAGLKNGDLIVSVNGNKIKSSDSLAEFVTKSNGGKLSLTVISEGETVEKEITPVYYKDSEEYKLGLWVRDSIAGIGTITYINPKDKSFAALGHAVEDPDTKTTTQVGHGSITECSISHIEKGNDGQAGEIRGSFSGEDIGIIKANKVNGIYGYLNTECEGDTVPIAVSTQVKKGKAQIYASVDNEGPRLYDIEITKVRKSRSNSPKSMVLKVTDKRLIEKTGGIVQGMSGCPIIQEGKLVGAVTHVFVNDPTSGYGIFAEWMYESFNEAAG